MASKALAQLNEKQQAFVRAYVLNGDSEHALKAAGYSENVGAHYLLRSPAVALAIRAEAAARLNETGAAAINILFDLARDSTVPPAVRRNCAKDLALMAGFVPPKAKGAASDQDKPLSERTTEEIRALVDQLEEELSGRARPVNAQPVAPETAKPVEFLD